MHIDTATFLLSAILLAVGLFYLVVWLRGGNGQWRWKYDSLLEKREAMDVNSPLYGLMSLVALAIGGWFLVLAIVDTGSLSESWRFFGRVIVAVPAILLKVTVAIIRKPWQRHKKEH